jgi:hypothetical protein
LFAIKIKLFCFFQFEKFFKKSSLILFLNKKDLFEEKISQPDNRFREFFPDYNGPDRNPESSQDFILSRFVDLLPEKRQKKSFYQHFTCATDTQNIKNIFKVVRNRILQDHMKDVGLK